MSHAAQRAFFASVKARFPEAFQHVRALDCGSLDVNGSLASLFEHSEYLGVDLRPGRNVSLVARIHEMDLEPWGQFSTIVSAEMLEHDEHWEASLRAMYRLLETGGLLALSMAAPGRPEHGTARVPDDAGLPGDGIWGTSPDYYRPLAHADLCTVFDLDRDFRAWEVTEDVAVHDLYFWGLKA